MGRSLLYEMLKRVRLAWLGLAVAGCGPSLDPPTGVTRD